jgi:hypothetical protein
MDLTQLVIETAKKASVTEENVSFTFSKLEGAFVWEAAIFVVVRANKGKPALTRTFRGYHATDPAEAAAEAVEDVRRFRNPTEVEAERTRDAQLRVLAEVLGHDPEALARAKAKLLGGT